MTAFNTIRGFRCPIGVCITMSIALIFGCDFLCDLGVVSFQAQQPAPVSESAICKTEREHAHDPSGHHHNQKSHDHAAAAHHDQSPGEDGCCDDYTQQFYSSLVRSSGAAVSIVQSELYKIIGSITFGDTADLNLAKILPVKSRLEHRSNGPPGGSGQVIRVFISSFLI